MAAMKPGKSPVHSESAEQGVLGCIFLSPVECMEICQDALRGREKAFFDYRHQIIYENMVQMYEAKLPIDLITVQERLRNLGQLKMAGDLPYLSAIVDAVPSASNLTHYLGMVVEKYLLRQMVEGVDQLRQRLQEAGERPVAEFVNQFDRMALGFREMTTKQGQDVNIKESLMELISIYDNASKGMRIPSVPTGFTAIDRRLGGLRPGELIIIGARPKVGKTTLGINIAQHAALHGFPTGIFSLEMKDTELLQRMVSSHSEVPSKVAEDGFATDAQKARMTASMGKIVRAPIMMRDDFSITIEQIALQCRKWKKTRGLKLVVIDYLQLIDRPAGMKPVEAISEMTRRLKCLAGDLDLPIVLMSQLNRLSDQDQRPPRLSDLRDCGSIEQDANLIFLLHPDGQERSKVHIIFAGRRCPSDSDTLLFHREINRFENEPTEMP